MTEEVKEEVGMTAEEMKTKDVHTNAAALIVAAAWKSGLLKEVAEALCFFDKHQPPFDCAACGLYEKLAEAFDEHTGLTGIFIEGFYCSEGLVIGGYTEAELAPYLA